MNAVVRPLDLRVRRELKPIPETDFPLLISEASAVRYCIEKSGLQDKSIAIETGTDPAVLSKAKLGQARLNDEAQHSLQDATGIEAILWAHCIRRGYDPRSLRRFETELEQENRELREQLAKVEEERRIETRTIRGLMKPDS